MNMDRECSNCRVDLVPGMYAFEVGSLRYCQGCVRKVIVGPDLESVPLERVPDPRPTTLRRGSVEPVGAPPE